MSDPNHPHFIENRMQEVEPPLNEEEEDYEDEDDEEEEEEEDYEEEEDDEEDEEEEEEEDERDGNDVGGADNERLGTTSGHVMHDHYGNGILRNAASSSSQEVLVLVDIPDEDGGGVAVDVKRECNSQGKGFNVCIGGSTASLNGDDDEVIGEYNRGEIDGLFCPICYEAWSSGGDHHICCLPCGHIYGLSCIKKWLSRQGSSKCPQCKKKCRIKDIRLLYATQVVAIDGELRKKAQTFEAKCASLEKMVREMQGADWAEKEVEWKKKEAGLCKQVQYLKELGGGGAGPFSDTGGMDLGAWRTSMDEFMRSTTEGMTHLTTSMQTLQTSVHSMYSDFTDWRQTYVADQASLANRFDVLEATVQDIQARVRDLEALGQSATALHSPPPE